MNVSGVVIRCKLSMRIDSSAAEVEPDVGLLDPTHPHIRAMDAWIADCHRAAKPERNSVMRTHTIVIAGTSLMALVSIAKTDDHLYEATQHRFGTWTR